MNIAMISHYLPSGSKIGAGYQAHYMANALVQRGHRVTMFSPCPRPDDAAYEHKSVPVGRRLRTFRFAWNLRRMGLEAFDVIHAHGDDYWLWGRRWPPHVRTMHGSCLAEALHHPRWIGKLRMAMLGASEWLATLVADRTICVSRDTLRYYPGLSRVICNGVDLSAFRPGAKASRPTILFVGTYENRKRGRLLMEVFADAVRPAIPEAELWMVCQDAPAAPGVRVLGRLSFESLCECYRQAWVFCLPSSYEGFGVPYIEAMASGTAVVATPNPGAREVLDEQRYGRLVEPNDLGTCLVELLRDPEQRRQWEVRGLERAQAFAWDRVVSEYEKVYQEIGVANCPCDAGPAPAGREVS